MTTKFDISDIAFVPVKIMSITAEKSQIHYNVNMLGSDLRGELCYDEHALLTETEVSEYLSKLAGKSQKDLAVTAPQQKPTFLEDLGMPCAHDDSSYYRCPVCKAIYINYGLTREQLDGEPFVCDCGTLVSIRQLRTNLSGA